MRVTYLICSTPPQIVSIIIQIRGNGSSQYELLCFQCGIMLLNAWLVGPNTFQESPSRTHFGPCNKHIMIGCGGLGVLDIGCSIGPNLDHMVNFGTPPHDSLYNKEGVINGHSNWWLNLNHMMGYLILLLNEDTSCLGQCWEPSRWQKDRSNNVVGYAMDEEPNALHKFVKPWPPFMGGVVLNEIPMMSFIFQVCSGSNSWRRLITF